MDTLQTPKLISRREAAAMLRVCISTFDKLRLPSVRLCRRPLYRIETINAYIVSKEQPKETHTGRSV